VRVTVLIQDDDLDIGVRGETEPFEVDPVLVEQWTNGTPAELFQDTIKRAWAAYKHQENSNA
jgi:hypothetical protein